MTDDASPENLRKFLESDDPAMVRMGLSMAKGSGVPEELLPTILGLYMWDDDKSVRGAAKSVFMKHAPDELKDILRGTWSTSYRTIKTEEALQRKVEAMLPAFKDTPFDSVDVWVPALSRSVGDKVAIASVLGTLGEPAVEPLIKTLGGDDWRANWAARNALVKIGKPAVEPLIKALGDEDDDVRKFTAEALGEIGDAQAVEPLIKALEDDSWDVRKFATEALGEIGNARAVEPLIEVLGDEDYDVRCHSAEVLGNIGDARAVEPLIKALEDDGYGVAKAAAEALEKIGDERAVEPLIKALEEGTWRAAEALRKFGIKGLQGFITAGKGERLTVSELNTILKENGLSVSGAKAQLIQRLTKFKADAKKSTEKITGKDPEKLLKSENTAMIQKGLSMVKKNGVPEELLPTILRLYMWDDDKTIRAAAKSVFNKCAPAEIQAKVKEIWKPSYRTLSITGDKFPETIRPFLEAFKSQDEFVEIALEPLIKALEDGNWKVRNIAAKALGDIGDARAVEPLIKALGEGNLSAAGALGKIGDERAIEPLIKALGDDDRNVRKSAAGVLGGIGKLAVEPLIKALEDEVQVVRHFAAIALGRIGDARAVEPLIKALEDEDESVRDNAAEALGKIGDARAVEPLIQALKHEGLFWHAAEALGEIGNVRAVEPLVDALGDEALNPTRVRVRAAYALGSIGDSRVVEPLIKALGDDNEDICASAAVALGDIGDARAVEPLIKALEDEDGDVRTQAQRALGRIGDARAVEPLIKAFRAERRGGGLFAGHWAKEALKKLGHEV
jgi:HEAT repeat protein